MKKRLIWLVVSCWMVAALLLASCAPAAVKEEAEKVAPPKEKEEVVVSKEVVVPKEEANTVKWTGTKRDGTVVEKMIEKPKYSGTHIAGTEVQPLTFDAVLRKAAANWVVDPTNEELITRDWTRGPAGTGEWTAQHNIFPSLVAKNGAGVLAESWELPDPETVVFHIRKGVHWQDKPPLNGRELTADDVVFSMRREWEKGFVSSTARNLVDMKNLGNSIYVSPSDKWAVVLKTEPLMAWVIWEKADVQHILPREVIEKYGDMNDWKNVVGTGPFILQDYVGASSLTYVRNPNYWQKDPFFPENQLPYLDAFKVLIIPDLSTRLAALRTSKIERISEIKAEDAEPLWKTNPELGGIKYLQSTPLIYMRNDIKPFDDIRVRRALSMSIDKRELTDVYYEGKAELFSWPVPPIPEHMDVYIPLEEYPESVRELYDYNPEKARQLLAEAGYPNGFKTEILTNVVDVDFVSIIKGYWAKIGVDLELIVREPAVFSNMQRNRTYQMLMTTFPNFSSQQAQSGYLMSERPGTSNYSNLGTWGQERYDEVARAVALDPKRGRLEGNKEANTYRLEQAWYIALPNPYKYVVWQPWLKNYYGTLFLGRGNEYGYVYYAWIDQELKKAMGR